MRAIAGYTGATWTVVRGAFARVQADRRGRILGMVILEAVLEARGQVESVRVLRSIPLLDQAAVDAVRQ